MSVSDWCSVIVSNACHSIRPTDRLVEDKDMPVV
jgi:hypothetical protein